MWTTSRSCTRTSSRAASPTSPRSPPTTSTARTWASATPSATRSGSFSRGRSPRRRRHDGGHHGQEETNNEGQGQARQEHCRDQKEVRGIHGRGKGRDDGPRPGAEDRRAQGGGGKRPAREDRRDAGTGSRHGQAAPRNRQSQRAGPLADNLVRDAGLYQGRQGRLLLPKRPEVQDEVRDVRFQRPGEPRRRRHVASRLRAEGVECRRRGKDRRAREESGELRTELDTWPRLLAGPNRR